jgi:hypothetical protein
LVDEAVALKLIRHVGAEPHAVYGKQGKQNLLRKLNSYNNAARNMPWFVLVDLNGDADCASALRIRCLPNPAPFLCFGIAVRQIEAWLLADAETLARYLGVSRGSIPSEPERLDNPKREMVELARKSRNRAVRLDMTPRPESGRPVGPAYASRLMEYATRHWRPEMAAQHADSLRRAIACLERLIGLVGV